jgi:hypothetical protein
LSFVAPVVILCCRCAIRSAKTLYPFDLLRQYSAHEDLHPIMWRSGSEAGFLENDRGANAQADEVRYRRFLPLSERTRFATFIRGMQSS